MNVVTALFAVAKIWKQPSHPSIDKWKGLWYILYNVILLSCKMEMNC